MIKRNQNVKMQMTPENLHTGDRNSFLQNKIQLRLRQGISTKHVNFFA